MNPNAEPMKFEVGDRYNTSSHMSKITVMTTFWDAGYIRVVIKFHRNNRTEYRIMRADSLQKAIVL